MPNPNLPSGGADPQPTRKLKNWLDEVLLSQRLEDDQSTDLLDRTVSSEMQYMSLALKLQEKGICTVNEDKIPANLKYTEGLESFSNILYGLFRGNSQGSMPSAGSIDRSVQQLHSELRRDLQDHHERIIIQAPTQYGASELSEENQKKLLAFSKPFADLMNIESRLRFLTRFHADNLNKFSEQSLLDNLHLVLPRDCQAKANTWVLNGHKLQHIFDKLTLAHGQSISIHQLREGFLAIDKQAYIGSTRPQDLIAAVEKLADKCLGNRVEIDKLCLDQSFKLLKISTNEVILITVKNGLSATLGSSFLDLLTLIKVDYNDLLNSNWNQADRNQKKQLHHLTSTSSYRNPPLQEDNPFYQQDSSRYPVHTNFHNPESSNQTPTQDPPYTLAGCYQHNGIHQNKYCPNKRVPCKLQNHHSHFQADCLTRESLRLARINNLREQNQPDKSNYTNQPHNIERSNQGYAQSDPRENQTYTAQPFHVFNQGNQREQRTNQPTRTNQDRQENNRFVRDNNTRD